MASFSTMENQFELRHPVTPYICSTPADFHKERDWLLTEAFPHLAEVCRARGTYLSPVDVRWSQDDPVAQDGQLLTLLLDLITNSSPYFLCLLGECYGPYRADGSLPVNTTVIHHGKQSSKANIDWLDLNFSRAAQCGHSWVLQDGHENCSIPELEIMAATFRGSSEHCAFYYRQSEHLEIRFPDLSDEELAEASAPFLAESEHAGLKMQSLKQAVVKKGLPVSYFKSPQELGDLVCRDWITILNAVHPPLVDNGSFLDTAQYKVWLAREALLTRLQSNFVTSIAMDSLLDKLTDFALSSLDTPPPAQDSEFKDTVSMHSQSASEVFRQKPEEVRARYQSILLLSGDRGAGKSVALANWLKQYAKDSPVCLIHNFMGTYPGDNDIAVFLRHCVRELRRHFLLTEVASCDEFDEGNSTWWSDADSATPENFPALCQAFIAAASLGPCVLVLDGINDLSATHGLTQQEVKEFEWLPFPLPPHCRIILSTTHADLTFRSLHHRKDVTVVMAPGLGDNSSKMSHLEAFIKPHVAPHIKYRKEQICEMRMLGSPLALCILGTQLNSYNNHTNLDNYIDAHYDTGSLRAYWAACLQQWILEHSWTRDDDVSVASKDDGQFDYSGWVADALCLLAVARGGLRQDELLQILKTLGYNGPLQVTKLHWLQFRLRAGALLWETADGCIRFSHQHLQNITEYILMRSVSTTSSDITMTSTPTVTAHLTGKSKVHAQLVAFFSQQPLSWRQLQELPWHLMMCGDADQLLAFLTHSRVVYMMMSRRDKYPDAHRDMEAYWRILGQLGHKPGLYYLRMMKDLGLRNLPSNTQALTEGTVNGHCDDAMQPASEIVTDTVRFESPTPSHQMDAGCFLTSPAQRLSIPDILDGVDGEEKKVVVSAVAWGVAQFLMDVNQTQPGTALLSSLLRYLQTRFPLPEPAHLLLVRALQRLGSRCMKDGDLTEATTLYHQALRVTFDLDAMEEDACDPRLIATFKGVLLGHHGYLHMVEGELLEAGELLKEATESISHLTGNHVLRASLLYHSGLLRIRLGEYSRAEASLRQALALRLQWHGQHHPEVADVLLALARLLNSPAHAKQQDRHEVEGLYRRALLVSERCLSSHDLQVAQILLELGEILAADGNKQELMEARDLLQRSLDMRTTVLGADDPSTRGTRQSVRRVEVALQLSHQDPARRADPQAVRARHGPRSVRTSSRAGQAARVAGGAGLGANIDVRSVSRESVLRHNRPDSIMSASAFSLMSASERLLASRPQSSALARVKAGSRVPSAASSMAGRASLSAGWSARSPFLTEAPDPEERRGEGRGEQEEGEADRERSSPFRQHLVVDLPLSHHHVVSGRSSAGGDSFGEERKENTPEVETPRLDSFAMHLEDGTILIGDRPRSKREAKARKRVSVRPSSAHRRLFQRYANAANASDSSSISNAVVVKPRHPVQRSGPRSRAGSARSGVTSLVSTGSSHVSRCRVPGAHDIHPSNARTLQGPHSDISSLLGPPPCPRDNVDTRVHHQSAFYHVPGRYPTNTQRYPPRRCQKTQGARMIESVLSVNLAHAQVPPGATAAQAHNGAARPPNLGVNQRDVTFLVRQTGVNRPDSRGGAILASARGTPNSPAVKFREPIAVI